MSTPNSYGSLKEILSLHNIKYINEKKFRQIEEDLMKLINNKCELNFKKNIDLEINNAIEE